MRETIRRMEVFSFYDRTGLERHLQDMAARGWLLEGIGQFLWTYRRTEPRTLTFSVCYFPKASAFDPGPSEEQETFYDFCAHTGWALAASSAQLQVFYNARQDPTPIETDPVLEVDAIHRSMRRSGLPAQLALMAVALLNGALFVYRLLLDPIGVLASKSGLFTGLCWVLMLLAAGMEVVSYLLWHRRAVSAAEEGVFLESKSHRKFQIATLAAVTAGLIWYLLSIAVSGNRMMMVIAAMMFLIYLPGVFLATRGIKELLKRKKVSARVNRVVTIAMAFLAAYGLTAVIVMGTLYGSSHGWFAGDRDTYEYHGNTFTVYDDTLPLTVEDLLDVRHDGYIRERREECSILLARLELRQHPRFDADDYREMPTLEYTVTLVRFPALYRICKNALLAEYDGSDEIWPGQVYVQQDAAPWGAEEAYRVRDPEYGDRDRWLLCYPDRFVELHPDWELTPEQMGIVGQAVGISEM